MPWRLTIQQDGELDDLLKLEEGLNDWELDFVENVSRRRSEAQGFTDKQTAKISDLWDCHCKK